MKILIVGVGYVGFANALVLSKNNNVVCVDISQNKVDRINQNKPPTENPEAELFMNRNTLSLKANTCLEEEVKDAEYAILALPTNYVDKVNGFDTSTIKDVIKAIQTISKEICIVIRSTVPIGFTENIQTQLDISNELVFVPEFLREGSELHDALNPSRIILGCKDVTKKVDKLGKLLLLSTSNKEANVLCMRPSEAESVKLFANSYLAMRVSFFNELDSFALNNKISSQAIIDGISQDPRIGDHYNNPSFGYGGYCLPKDTKQLLSSFTDTPQALIESVVISNAKRKEFITDNILKLLDDPKGVVGVFRLIMKSNTDNFRSSAVLDIASSLSELGIRVLIYEPNLKEIDITKYSNFKIEDDLDSFKLTSHIIIANRFSAELDDVSEKTYTRDIFNNN
ncbi:nucleotide sugar dehydrogenase [Gammaproteobacteria bacterium]|nr:nucleotide sugar dehydrogenase [Gammaproteobacteria bacterium]